MISRNCSNRPLPYKEGIYNILNIHPKNPSCFDDLFGNISGSKRSNVACAMKKDEVAHTPSSGAQVAPSAALPGCVDLGHVTWLLCAGSCSSVSGVADSRGLTVVETVTWLDAVKRSAQRLAQGECEPPACRLSTFPFLVIFFSF